MKKIIALVLALVMTLSLLPMNVWATDGEQNQQQNQLNNVSTPTDYKELYYFDGDEYHANFNANISNREYPFRCATEKSEAALVGTAYGYSDSNLSTEGNIGTFIAREGDCVWNLASATDVEGYLRVEKENTVYRMKVTINNGRNVFTYQGVDIYTAYDNSNLSYGNWNYNDLSLDINGGNGISTYVPYVTDAETTTASAYLKPAAGLRLVLPSHRQNYTTLSSIDNNGVYVLTNNDLSQNTSVQVYNGEQLVGEIDLMFIPRDGSGNQGGNDDENQERSTREYPISQYTKVVFDVRPDIAQVVTFPAELNEQRELVLTVNEVDAELWRPLLNSESGFWIPYKIVPIVPGDVNASPQIASGADIYDPSLDEFTDYGSAVPRIYSDSVVFAWASEPDENGVTTIMPRSQGRDWAVRWKYGDDLTTNVDTVVVKSVLGANVGAIELGPVEASPIDAGRVALVDDYANKFAHLDTVLSFAEYTNNGFAYGENAPGVLTYRYKPTDSQADPGEVIYAAAGGDQAVTLDEQSTLMYYDLLTVTAPDGYVAKKMECPYYTRTTFGASENTVTLRYHWDGFGTEQKYVLTWRDANGTNDDIVEYLTIAVPNMEGLVPWMSFVVGGENPVRATAVPSARLKYTLLDDVVGVSEHEYNESTGVLLTTYDSSVQMNIEPVLDAVFSIEKPADTVNGASVNSYQLFIGYDGTEDASYSKPRNKWKFTSFWEIAFGREAKSLDDNGYTNAENIAALNQVNYGVNEEIEYFYSADEGNRFVLIKWNYTDGSAKYEYMRLNTTSYFCQWETDVAADDDIIGAVEAPTAIYDSLANSNIKLVTRVHPQKQEDGYGQYFFELEMVAEGEGNVYTDPDDEGTYFTIILPYSFMGEDWNYEKAKNLEKKPMITHFDKEYKKLAGNKGTITGEYTERGIEFKVNSFSPFTVSWDETLKENTGGSPGGYYPIVTPTTPVEKPEDTTPTETKPVVTPTEPVEDDVTPTPEDTTPVVPDTPVIDDGAVDEPPVDDATQPDSSNAGLWIGIGIVALAAIVVVLAIMAVRKKRK